MLDSFRTTLNLKNHVSAGRPPVGNQFKAAMTGPILTQTLVPKTFHQSFYYALVVFRCLSGFAVGLLIQRTVQTTAPSDQNLLLMSAAVTGIGLSVAFHHACRLKFGSGFSLIGATACLVIGFGMISYSDCLTARSVFVVCVALSHGVDWVTAPGVLQDCLPTAVRWKRTSVWLAAFFLGSALGIAISGSLLMNIAATTAASGLLIAFAKMPVPVRRFKTSLPEEPTTAIDEANPPAATSTNDLSDTDPDNADEPEVECCGGAARQFSPPSFAVAVLLNVVGIVCFWWGLRLWLLAADQQTLFSIACALPFGAVLIFTMAPRTGYTVALLPVLLLGIATSLVACLFASRFVLTASTFVAAVSLVAVSVGTYSITTELLSNEDTDPVRTRVFCVACFASGLLMLADFVLMNQRHVSAAAAFQLAVFVVTFLILRLIPTPVVSSLGDSGDQTDDPEYADVVAALKQR